MQLPSHICPDKFKSAFNLIDHELDEVKRQILSSVCGDKTIAIQDVIESLRSTIFSGKMIRPALVLLSGKAFGKITNEHIRVAALIEIIHNATLLHDDVIDEGRKRRGVPTLSSLMGNESAVLLGDLLLSAAFRMCADLQPQIVRIIADAAARTCKGELSQIIQRRNWRLSEPEYMEIITEKTAALFGSCCELGSLLAGADETDSRSLADFGLNLGITFQITDDLLDIIGDENKTGKTLGSDADKNKLTLAVIHLLRTVDESQENAMIEKFNTIAGDKKAIAEMLCRFGSLEYAEAKAQEFATRAIELLADLKQSDAKSALVEMVRLIADRVKIHRV